MMHKAQISNPKRLLSSGRKAVCARWVKPDSAERKLEGHGKAARSARNTNDGGWLSEPIWQAVRRNVCGPGRDGGWV